MESTTRASVPKVKKQLARRWQRYELPAEHLWEPWGLLGRGTHTFTHTTTWDLWLHCRVCSATLNTYGLGLPFNNLFNGPPHLGEHVAIHSGAFLTCCYPLLWDTRPQTLIKGAPCCWIDASNQLACRCQRYVGSVIKTHKNTGKVHVAPDVVDCFFKNSFKKFFSEIKTTLG